MTFVAAGVLTADELLATAAATANDPPAVTSIGASASRAKSTSEGRLGATTTGVVTSVVTPEEASALDQTMVDLEIPSWETLEEQVNEPSVVPSRGVDSESANDETYDSERYSSSSPIEEEERALTAAALNDLFYLVDAQADAVNALEAVFASGDAAASGTWTCGMRR